MKPPSTPFDKCLHFIILTSHLTSPVRICVGRTLLSAAFDVGVGLALILNLVLLWTMLTKVKGRRQECPLYISLIAVFLFERPRHLIPQLPVVRVHSGAQRCFRRTPLRHHF